MQFVELNPACPCDPCDYGYRITIEKHVKYPGVNNNEDNRKKKSYSGIIPVLSCSGTPSTIDDLLLRQMEDDLITQISEDTGMLSNNSDLITGSMSVAEARKAFLIEISNAETFVITEADGTATTITGGATALLSAHAVNNSAANGSVFAYVVYEGSGTDDQIMVISRSNGVLFDIATATLVGTTIEAHYIAFMAKSADVQFAIQYDLGFATTTRGNLMIVTGTTTAGTTTVGLTYAGTRYTTAAVNDHTTPATYAANIQVGITALATPPDLDIIPSYDTPADRIYIWASENVTDVWLEFSALSTSVATYYLNVGQWPSLTGTDVFGIFFNQKDAGGLSAMTYLDQVNPDDEYCLYILKNTSDIYAQHGANHMDHYHEEVHVYVKKSILSDNPAGANDGWDSTNPAGLYASGTYNQQPDTNAAATAAWAPDTNFEELLEIWTNLAVSSW